LRLSVTAATGAALVTYLRRHIVAAHAILKPPLAELSIALVGDRRMAELHEQFLGIAGPTDVLTFPLEVDRRGRPLAGEVVVCVPEARRRSAVEGTGLKQEVLLYALHGLLHLCGFDDRTRSAFAAMHRTEDAILTSLGIGPVFSARGASRVKGAGKPPATALKPGWPDSKHHRSLSASGRVD
jgi:rRNA maturation RNase YbeY